MMDDKIKLLTSQLGDSRIQRDVTLAGHLQTRIPAQAAAFYIATATRELIRAVELSRELQIKFLIIGSGSKAVLSEGSLIDFVIKNRSDNIRIFGIKGKVSRAGLGIEEALLEVDSGVSLTRLKEFADKQGLGGLEGLENSLGTVGGSFLVNSIIREKTHSVRVLDRKGEIREIREIRDIKREDVILSAVFKLKAKKGQEEAV